MDEPVDGGNGDGLVGKMRCQALKGWLAAMVRVSQRRAVAMFVGRSDDAVMRAAIEAGVSAYVG